MRKNSLIEFYLQKVSDGDANFVGKLCRQLANRLLYVPVLNSDSHDGHETFNVIVNREDDRVSVPAFTTKEKFDLWCVRSDKSLEFIDILGADLCASLGEATWLLVDPSFGTGVELNPSFVNEVAHFEAQVEGLEAVDVPAEEGHEEVSAEATVQVADSAAEEVAQESVEEVHPDASMIYLDEPAPEADEQQAAPAELPQENMEQAEILEVNQPLSPEPVISASLDLSKVRDNYLTYLSENSKQAFTEDQPNTAENEAKEESPADRKKKSFLNFLMSGRTQD